MGRGRERDLVQTVFNSVRRRCTKFHQNIPTFTTCRWNRRMHEQTDKQALVVKS